MARRRQSIGRDEGDDIVDAYAQAYFKRGQQEDPRMDMAIRLMGMQQNQQEAALNREEKARAQQAEELWRSGQLGIEREKLGVTAKEAEAAEKARQEERTFREGATTRDIQYKMDQAAREQEKALAEQANKLKEIKGRILQTQIAAGRPLTPMEEAQLGDIDPAFKDVAAGMREKAIDEAVKRNLEAFRSKTPEQRKAMLQNQVAINELGGMDVYNRMVQQLGEQPAAAPQQGFWSRMFSGGAGETTGAPARPSVGEQLMSPEGISIGDIIAPRVTVDPELRSGRTRGAAPVEPAPDYTNLYGPGYPSAQRDYETYGIQTPTAESVINRVNADPRFQPAEDQIMKAAMDWWHRQTGGGQPPQFPAYGWMGGSE